MMWTILDQWLVIAAVLWALRTIYALTLAKPKLSGCQTACSKTNENREIVSLGRKFNN